MLTKWKKSMKFLATTIIVLIYVTTGLLNQATIKRAEERQSPPRFALPAMRTVVGYSDEYRMRREMEDRIDCQVARGGGRRHDDHLGIRVFSAYHDHRLEPYHYVRVVALLRRNSSFYCQLCYDANQTASCVTRKAVAHEIWSPEWGPKAPSCDNEYPAIISCLAPLRHGTPAPSWVSFVDESCTGGATILDIADPVVPPRKANFVVCVKPLHFVRLRPSAVLEWLDINLSLGADKIVLYGLNSTQRGSVLGNYAGGRRPVEWRELITPQSKRCPPSNFEDSVWHKRKMEIIAYNDCFYSNLYYAKFVIPLDVDEIIVPKTGNNWLEAFRSHFGKLSGGGEEGKSGWPPWTDRYASFSVRNAYFFAEYPRDAILMFLPKRKVPRKLVRGALGGGEIFGRTLRSYKLSPSSDSVKSFVHVAKTVSVFNHYAFHVLGEGTARQLIMPEDVFQLNHYRNSCDPVLIDGCGEFLSRVVYDDSLEKLRKRKKRQRGRN